MKNALYAFDIPSGLRAITVLWALNAIIMQNVRNTTGLRSRVERDQFGRSVLARVPII